MRAKLVFNSFLKFWEFKQMLSGKKLKASLRTRSIVGEYTDSEIKLAIHAYQANVKEAG